MIAPTQKLLEHKTADYEQANSSHGTWGLLWFYNLRNKPPFQRLRHVPAMLVNWRVQMALQSFEGAITSLSHFFIKEENEEIKQFLINQVERWWRNSASKMIYGALPYGFYGAETLYRIDSDGHLAFNTLKSFQAQDVFPVTFKGELAGIQIRNFRGSHNRYVGGEKALWHVHMREMHPWWGQSRLLSAYEPWLDLVSEGGGLDVQRLYFWRNVLQNDIIYHPDDVVPDENGQLVHTRDIARSMVEKQRSGGVYTLPSTRDMNGNLLWEVTTKDTTGGAEQVIQNVDVLADRIAEGMGIPAEVFNAAETGSGFSGRKIPETVFRGILTNIVQWMVNDIDEQCFRPLVKSNFGIEPNHEITPFGLVRDEGDEGQGEGNMQSSSPGVPNESVKMAAEGALAV